MLYVAAPSSEQCHEVLTSASHQGVMFVDVHLCFACAYLYLCVRVGGGEGLQQCQLLHWSGVHVAFWRQNPILQLYQQCVMSICEPCSYNHIHEL